MGRPFIDHIGGENDPKSDNRPVLCVKCNTPLTNKDNLESSNYQGSTGKAYLYSKAVNIRYGEVNMRDMMTGKHYVRDIFCKGCGDKLGWMYELAVPESQRHKEGKVILEKKWIKEAYY